MTEAVLVLNAGSATLKYALYSESLECLARGLEEGASHDVMLARILSDVEAKKMRIAAAGHRVVHGGDKYALPVLLDASVMQELEALCPLAPL
ncbi:MAG TPA: hypothetical protein VFB08_12850, partial [Burkholderiales bacterium]|nr:hypothetical protein [Burkholderiales bacterium]